MDPLSLVRHSTINRIPVGYKDEYYEFGEHKCHQSVKTAFRRTIGGTYSGYYTLRDVIIFLENADVAIAKYRLEANNLGVTAVTLHDKPNLKNYLTGQIDTCEQIDPSALVAYAASVEASSHALNITSDLSAEQTNDYKEQYNQIFDQILLEIVPNNSNSNRPKGDDTNSTNGKRNISMMLQEFNKSMDTSYMKYDKTILGEVRSNEFAASNRTMSMCKPGTEFSFALKLYNEQILNPNKKNKPSSDSSHSNPSSSVSVSSSMSTSTAIQDNKLVQRKSNAPPIIIVPNSLTTPISILNVLKFLKDGEYVSAEELKKQGVRREGQHTFQRVEDDKNSTFVIVDSVAKFRESDWDRVVAVIALGQPWQFKDWKWSNPVDLFNNVCGVHIAWDDRAVDSNIQSWNCKVLKINKTKRHLDAGAVNEFWNIVDEHIRLHKPYLMRSTTQK